MVLGKKVTAIFVPDDDEDVSSEDGGWTLFCLESLSLGRWDGAVFFAVVVAAGRRGKCHVVPCLR